MKCKMAMKEPRTWIVDLKRNPSPPVNVDVNDVSSGRLFKVWYCIIWKYTFTLCENREVVPIHMHRVDRGGEIAWYVHIFNQVIGSYEEVNPLSGFVV
jgi:hypothetical protein